MDSGTDESNLVKNYKAKRTQRITQLASMCPYRIILNGTPISRNEADLFAQWYLLDWRILGYRSFYSFAANHLEYDDYGRIRRCLNTNYLTEKIAPYTYQVSKEECLDLPGKNYLRWRTYMSSIQSEHYDEIIGIMIDMIDEQRPETIYRMFSASQSIISGRWVDLGENNMHITTKPMYEDPNDNPRIETLLDIVREIKNEKTIIYCKYTHEITDILQVLPNSVAFHGGMSQRERQKSLARFGDDVQFLVANKTCAGYGLNLQFCNNIIYYSNDWNWATRAQSEDRVHRIGQDKDVQIYDIYERNSLDLKILECLYRKESLNDEIKREIKSANNITDAKGKFRQWLKGELEDAESLQAKKCV